MKLFGLSGVYTGLKQMEKKITPKLHTDQNEFWCDTVHRGSTVSFQI